jgi:diketogulonate reductase-like aldo/keto reductase
VAKARLTRMGVSYFDLLLVHWIEPNISIESYIRSLENIAEKGYTRYIGVSNFYLLELKKAIEATKKFDIVVDQVKYSVYDKAIEYDLLPFAIQEKITIQAYTPIERGRLSTDRRLKEIALRYGRTPIQVALNYLISHEFVTAIPKTERRERIREFYGALGWRLNVEDFKKLSRV